MGRQKAFAIYRSLLPTVRPCPYFREVYGEQRQSSCFHDKRNANNNPDDVAHTQRKTDRDVLDVAPDKLVNGLVELKSVLD